MRMIMVFITLLALTGCSTVPMATAPLNQKLSWNSRQTQLNSFQNWQIDGAVGIRYQQRAQTANVLLIQTGNTYHLELYGPLGADRVVLEGNPEQVALKQSNGEILTAKTPDALLQQRLGWSVPVSNLYYWLRGLPVPGQKPQITFDPYHHILALQQSDWRINYLAYAGVNNVDLPTKIILQNPKLRITIVISQWKINT